LRKSITKAVQERCGRRGERQFSPLSKTRLRTITTVKLSTS
jgi:hypothetical protein